MTWSASEFCEAALALPPSVRKDLALLLLDSIEVADQESVDDAGGVPAYGNQRPGCTRTGW